MKILCVLSFFNLILFACKKEKIEILQEKFCWDCKSYVTTIDTLHKEAFQSHIEMKVLCNKTEQEISKTNNEVIYRDTFFISRDLMYICFKIYKTECKKSNKN
jgi:hypothetical protein